MLGGSEGQSDDLQEILPKLEPINMIMSMIYWAENPEVKDKYKPVMENKLVGEAVKLLHRWEIADDVAGSLVMFGMYLADQLTRDTATSIIESTKEKEETHES